MSFKVYSGYLLPVTTLSGLFKWKSRIQEKFERNCSARMSAEIARRAISFVDKQVAWKTLGLKIAPVIIENPYVDHAAGIACAEVENGLKKSPYRCLRDDYQLEFTVLFAKGKCLAMLHNDSRFCTNFFKAHSNARPLPYWDNTDPDPMVSEKNWKLREELWYAALPGAGVPAECGLLVATKDPVMYLWNREEIPTFPSQMSRAKTMATDYLIHIACACLEKDAEPHKYMQAINLAHKNPKRIENMARLIYPHLPTFSSWRELAKYPLITQYKAPTAQNK